MAFYCWFLSVHEWPQFLEVNNFVPIVRLYAFLVKYIVIIITIVINDPLLILVKKERQNYWINGLFVKDLFSDKDPIGNNVDFSTRSNQCISVGKRLFPMILSKSRLYKINLDQERNVDKSTHFLDSWLSRRKHFFSNSIFLILIGNKI